MRCMRQLVPALLCLMAVYPACAAEHGAHITLLVAQQGLERWEAACAASEGGTPALPLLLDADGRANLSETNLNWAVALMRTGENVELAAQVARAVLVHQDTADGSRTRGLFRWSAAPEAEFAQDATLYLAPALAELAVNGLPESARREYRESAGLALTGLLASGRPSGGVAAAMWAGAVSALSNAVGEASGQIEAEKVVAALLAQMRREGPGTIPSPTFDALRIGGLRWVRQFATTDSARATTDTLLQICYADLLQRYDPLTGIVTGPIGNAYPGEYLGQTGVAQYLLACDLPSALAVTREVSPLAMYFTLSEYELPPALASMAEGSRGSYEVRSRVPAAEGEGIEALSTCTWVGPGMSLGTMSGPVDARRVPILATCDLPERPTSYVYPFGGPATLRSAQAGGLALCSFNFDGVGLGISTRVGVACVLGRRDQIDRVLVGRHDWIGQPEAVGRNMVVAVRRGNTYLGMKILDTGPAEGAATPTKPGGIEWFAEGNMDSLVLNVYGRRAGYALKAPIHDVKVGLLIEVAPASQYATLEDFADVVSARRVTQALSTERIRTDELENPGIPGRHEMRSLSEMKWARYLYHDMSLVDETLGLGIIEELLRDQIVSRTLPVELPAEYLWVSPGLLLERGGEPVLGPREQAPVGP